MYLLLLAIAHHMHDGWDRDGIGMGLVRDWDGIVFLENQ